MIASPCARTWVGAALLLFSTLGRGADLSEPGRPPAWTMSDADVYSFGTAWTVTQDLDGRILAGTDGLVVFDGARWKYFGLPASYALRGIDVDEQGRIWVGAASDLGYFERQAAGDYTFHSLRAFLPPAVANSLTPIWSVNALPGEVVFSAEDALLIWRDHRFLVLALPGAPRLFTTRWRNELFVAHAPTGFYALQNDRLKLLCAAAEFGRSGTFATERTGPNRFLLVRGDGLWALDQGRPTRLSAAASAYLMPRSVTSAVRLPSGDLLVGMTKGGLTLLAPDGSIRRKLASQKGFPASVDAMFLDRRGELWTATLDEGVSKFDLLAPISFYDADNGLARHARTLTQWGPNLLVGSEDGLFMVSAVGTEHERPQLVSEDANVYSMFQWVNGRLHGGYLHGVDDLTHGQRDVIHTERNTSALTGSIQDPDTFYLATRNKVSRVRIQSDGSYARTPLTSVPSDVCSMVEDPIDGLIIGTVGSGLFRIPLDAEPPATPVRLPGPEALQSGHLAWIRRTGSHVIAATADQAFVERRDGTWTAITGLPSGVVRAITPSVNGGMWLILSHAAANDRPYNMLVRADALDSDRPFATEFDLPALQELGAVNDAVETDSGGRRLLWVGGRQGLARIIPERLTPVTPPAAPLLDGTSWSQQQRVLRIEYSSVDYRHVGDVLFQTRLLGQSAAWSPATHAVLAAFSGVREGRYSCQVRALAPDGMPSAVAGFDLTVAPPWYRTAAAYVLYVLAAAGVVGGLGAWRSRQMRRRQAELERIVAERTAELMDRSQQLEKASRAKDDFVASISHEIRNPLNGLIGLAVTLEASLHENTNALQRQHLSMLRHCAEHLSTLIEEILDFASIEAGKFGIVEQAFSVSHLLNSAYAVVYELSAVSGIPVDLQIAPSVPPRLIGDAKRIRQILLNYLYNALRYAGRGRVTLAVNARPAQEGWSDVTFSVADQGPGISRAEQAGLFTKFTRGELGRRSGSGGTGLGLAVCRTLAERMGGKTSVASELGSGATFFLSLTLRAAENADPSENAPGLFPLLLPALVVEDQPPNAAGLTALLERLGVKADWAPSAEAALALAQERDYAVIFSDWELPGLSGVDLARALRGGASRNRRTPIIALTAYATENKRREGLAAGMSTFATKPMTLEKLAAVLNETIPSAGQAFRLDALKAIARDDPARFALRIDAYVRDLDGYLDRLAAAAEEVDFESLRKTAHKLGSHLSLISHDAGYVLASALEQAGAEQDLAEAGAKLGELRFVLKELKAQLRAGATYS